MINTQTYDHMVQGIETNDKKLKYKRKDDIEYLSKDLNEIRKTAEHYINIQRPKDPKQLDTTIIHHSKKHMQFARMISAIIGIMGIFVLLHGILSINQGILVLGLVETAIGIVFIAALILFEFY
jgi:hypothetical protein